MARDYKKEYANYQGKPAQVKKRTSRNAARSKLSAGGAVRKGQAIRDAVNNALDKGIVTEDLADGGTAYGTKEVGDWLAANI